MNTINTSELKILTGKEVSCKFVVLLVNALKQHNIPLDILFDGVPYDYSYLLNKHERIDWNYWGRMLSNLKPYFTSEGFETLGASLVKDKGFTQGLIVSFIMFSPSKLARLLIKPLNNFVKEVFSCVPYRQEWLGKNNSRIIGLVDEGYETIPEFFMICKGSFEQYGVFAGVKNVKVDLTLLERGAVCDIKWEKSPGIFGRLTRILKLLFNIKKTFSDLSESYSALLEKYQKLDESKAILQKRAANLQTAYEITKSIQQIRDIETTLDSITSLLVKDTEIASASIKLLKDTEGAVLEMESFNGRYIHTKPLTRSIFINNESLGELSVQPKLEEDFSNVENLLDHILPVINISIYNSLVLRTVTDYKNNLEVKVEERTTELQKAQNELSKTISLLRKAQLAQNRFFTNVSHEFRTPLTLILGPAKQIMERANSYDIKEDARLIHRSAQKLNRLANQLLDISKIEAGRMKLKTGEYNLVQTIKEILSVFQSYAGRKNISVIFISSVEEIILYLDRDKFDKIMSNLLSNAIKFTQQGGIIKVRIELQPSNVLLDSEFNSNSKLSDLAAHDGSVEISVMDNGIGIPKKQIDKIFDRFYQVENKLTGEFEGTGVGLSLTKELIELHKGQISVISDEGKGSEFIVTLPLGKKHLLPDEIDEEAHSIKEIISDKINPVEDLTGPVLNKSEKNSGDILDSIKKNGHPVLLIVEDNSDVRKFISDILISKYKIIEASNGEDGLKKTLEFSDGGPDLIISDIMMPTMDGIQLCRRLKSDPRTSHIPLIMLTAKATLKDKLDGFETGADEYLMKPFEAEELKPRIKNLLEQRKRIHEYFKKHGLFEIKDVQITSADHKFLQKVLEIIENNIPEPSLSVDVLAENMSVSKSLLYKKLMALAGEPPGELIRRIRLNKAAKLIEHNSGNITEIAFLVGFNDPSYFTACFRKQFGITPSQYQKKIAN